MPKTTSEVAKAVRKPIRPIPLESKAEPGLSTDAEVVAAEVAAVVVAVVDVDRDLEIVDDTEVKADDVDLIADVIAVELILYVRSKGTAPSQLDGGCH